MRLQFIKDKKAMTVAEIIVSVFILALIAAIILPGLLYGYQQVHESGTKNTKVLAVQKELEKELVNPGDTATPKTIRIQFGSIFFDVEGKLVEKEEVYDKRGSKAKAKVFIPQE